MWVFYTQGCSLRSILGRAPTSPSYAELALVLQGMEAYGVRAFADALEVIPSTLAENAGLDPISIVTQLRNRHAQGDSAAGINVRKVRTIYLTKCL